MSLTAIDTENGPFGDAFDCRFVHFDGPRRRIQKEILNAIGRTNGLIFLSGEKGIGKTTMLHWLAEEIRTRPDCHLLGAVPFLTCRQDMALRDLAEEFSYTRYLARFGDGGSQQAVAAGAGGRAVILLDDAHRLSPKVVVQLRRWRRAFQSVRGRLSIILAICQEDDAATPGAIAGGLGTSGQDLWRQLRPFNRNDVQRLIHHRLDTAGYSGAMLFPPEAVTRVFDHTRGNPAKVVRLCRQVLALVSQGCGPVSAALVDAAARTGPIPLPSVASLATDVILPPTSGITLGALPAPPPSAADPAEQAAAHTEPPGRFRAFGTRAGLAGLVVVATTALAVGWFYGVTRERPETSIVALHHPASERPSATLASAQPGTDREDSQTAAAGVEEDLSSVSDRPVLLAQDRTAGQGDDEAVVPAAPVAGEGQPLKEAGAESSMAEPPAPAVESAPAVPEPAPAVPQPEPTAESALPESVAADPVALEPAAEPPPPSPYPVPAAADFALPEPAVEVPAPVPLPSPVAPVSTEPEASDAGQSAPGEDVPPRMPPRSTGPEVGGLLDRGNKLLELGDVAAARLFYTMAAERGSAEGAMLMGVTFDPVYFEGKSIYGTRPHVYEAMEWYMKSASMGSAEAEERMIALELWLRRTAQEGDEDAREALQLLDRQ